MPVIKIKSLRFKEAVDIPSVIKGLSCDFSSKTKIGIEHVSVTWEFFNSGHYAVSGITEEFQPRQTHPVIVELLIPDFNTSDIIELMFESIAESISKGTGISTNNIFITCSLARSKMVFDSGKVEKW